MRVVGDELIIDRHTIQEGLETAEIMLTGPDGKQVPVSLARRRTGRGQVVRALSQPGLYRVSDGEREAIALYRVGLASGVQRCPGRSDQIGAIYCGFGRGSDRAGRQVAGVTPGTVERTARWSGLDWLVGS